MQKCTEKVRTEMGKTNAIQEGKITARTKPHQKKLFKTIQHLCEFIRARKQTHITRLYLSTGHVSHSNTKQQLFQIFSAVF